MSGRHIAIDTAVQTRRWRGERKRRKHETQYAKGKLGAYGLRPFGNSLLLCQKTSMYKSWVTLYVYWQIIEAQLFLRHASNMSGEGRGPFRGLVFTPRRKRNVVACPSWQLCFKRALGSL